MEVGDSLNGLSGGLDIQAASAGWRIPGRASTLIETAAMAGLLKLLRSYVVVIKAGSLI